MRTLKVILITIFCNMAISSHVLACDEMIVLAVADIISLDEAIKAVKKNSKGKVLDAQTKQMNGQPVHVIKVLTDKGHVKKIRVQGTRK